MLYRHIVIIINIAYLLFIDNMFVCCSALTPFKLCSAGINYNIIPTKLITHTILLQNRADTFASHPAISFLQSKPNCYIWSKYVRSLSHAFSAWKTGTLKFDASALTIAILAIRHRGRC